MALTTIDDRGLKTPIDLLDNEKIRFGTGNDLEIFHDGAHSDIKNDQGNLHIRNDGETNIQNNGGSENRIKTANNGAVELYYDNSKKLETVAGGVLVSGDFQLQGADGGTDYVKWSKADYILTFKDSTHLEFGNSRDLQIYHDGNHSYIKDTGTGNLKIDGSDNVELQAGGSTKAYTYANGLFVYNQQIPDDGELVIGNGSDLKLYHNAQHSFIKNSTGNLYIWSGDGHDGNIVIQATYGEESIWAKHNGAVELYYDNSKKFETASHGITTLGDVFFDNQVNAGKDVYWDESADRLSFSDNTHATFGNGEDLRIYHDGNNSYIEDAGTGSLILKTGRVSFNDTGNNEMGRFDGEGLKFNGDTAAANALDDYEEGTWTPTYLAASTAPTLTSHLTTGYYTKVGNLVTVTHYTGSFTLSGSPSGTPYIGGLPFAAKSTGNNYATNSFTHTTCFTTAAGGYVSNGGSTIAVIQHGDNTSGSAWKNSGTQYLMIHFTYLAA